MISSFIAFLCVMAFLLLISLALIDLRTRLLPNTLVGAFFMVGFLFHILTLHSFVSLYSMGLGLFAGGGLLLGIRFVSNAYYGQDTLGLGDVKLMGAAGVWLGLEGIFLAITIGAFAGLVHGIAHKMILERETPLARLSIPAGPGFIVGILAVAVYQFWDLPKILLDLI